VVHRQSSGVDAELQAAAEDADILTLAGAVPADDLFPADSMTSAMTRMMAEEGPRALQYGWPAGVDGLRDWIVAYLARRGVGVTGDQVLVTSGAQQGLCLLATLLLPERTPVVVESPTYVAALQALDLRKPRIIPVKRSTAGLDTEALRRATRRAALLYVVSTGHNPTGGVLDRAQRLEVLGIAQRARCWVIDDDAYGEIQYGEKMPPLRSFGEHLDRVVHLGSFSKVLAPGLRVGWIAGPTELIRQATRVKQALDLETATLTQRILARWLADNRLEDHTARCLGVYRSRRDALLGALDPRLGAWDVPEGGFSLLFRPRIPVDATALLDHAVRHGVAFEPASPYHPGNAGRSTLRLSFANLPEAQIREAVRRLSAAISSFEPLSAGR
jgi:2-aminoadipate transaminase